MYPCILGSEPIDCLHGCTCDRGEEHPTIRCDSGNHTHLPLPITNPKSSYHFLQMTCNNIKTVPDVELIMKAYPDLQGIDFQGNPRLNCSSLQQFKSKLAILSDCSDTTSEAPTIWKHRLWYARNCKKTAEMHQEISKSLKQLNFTQSFLDYYDLN
ncbi:hypothetical protein B9Z55_026299 [Caenorhabditis nigoni]|uniref:LRRNT domain-containing protein n=2 Tax=Caenorhabditis nigoni TaxID=1611254 RepID=A0A2G5T313_9PELO|nr:hypothetical protein B9Z55_026299 [Caenorhabditis nigoni]